MEIHDDPARRPPPPPDADITPIDPASVTTREATLDDTQSQQIAWESLDALARNWDALAKGAGLDSRPDMISREGLRTALSAQSIETGDAETLEALLKDDQAFSLLDRLDGSQDGRLQMWTVQHYADVETARATLVSDAAQLDVANQGISANIRAAGDGMISWRDIQSRIADSSTPENLRRKLDNITRDTFDLLCGEHEYILISDLTQQPSTPAEPTVPPPADLALPDIRADAIDNPGITVAAFLDTHGSNADRSSQIGVAITASNQPNGAWQYSLDNGKTWLDVGPLSNTDALLLGPQDRVRFKPDGENTTKAALTFRAWDQSTGESGQKADTSQNGGTSAFSSGTGTITQKVKPPKQAPTSPSQTDQSKPATPLDPVPVPPGLEMKNLGKLSSASPDLQMFLSGGDQGFFSADEGKTWTDVYTPQEGHNEVVLGLIGTDGNLVPAVRLTFDYESDDIARARSALTEYFSFVDSAGAGAPVDGLVARADVSAAAKSTFLGRDAHDALYNLADNWEHYAASLGADANGMISWAALAGKGATPQPDIKQESYSEAFYQTTDVLASGELWLSLGKVLVDSGLPKIVNNGFSLEHFKAAAVARDLSSLKPEIQDAIRRIANDPAGFNALDRIDGTADGNINVGTAFNLARPRHIPASGPKFDHDWNAEILDGTVANDGSGDSVGAAAFSALYHDYNQRYESLTDNQKRFELLVEAQSALQNGIPLPNETTDIFPDEVAGILDPEKVRTKLAEVISTPEVSADLSAKIRGVVPDPEGTARKIYDDLTSDAFAAALKYARETGGMETSVARLQNALGMLTTLDPALAEKARSQIIGNLGWSQINSPHFGSFASNSPISDADATLAIADVFDTLTALRAARIGLRFVGNVATLVDDWPAILAKLNITPTQTQAIAADLVQALRTTENAGKMPVSAADVSMAARDPATKGLIRELNDRGIWGTSAGIFGVAAGAYALAGGGASLGDDAWGRIEASMNFVATASYGKGVITTGSWALGALMGKDLQTPLFEKTGLNMPFPELISAAKADGPISPKALGALVKGIVLGADITGGALSLALGIKGLINTAQSGGDAAGYVENIANTLSGAAWLAGAGLSVVGSSLATLAFVGSGALAIVSLLVSFITGNRQTGAQRFADGFASRWGSDLGLDLFRENWRTRLENFFAYSHPSALGFAATGAGIPTGRLDGSAPRLRPPAFGNF